MFVLREYPEDLRSVVELDSNSYDPAGLIRNVDRFAAIGQDFGVKPMQGGCSDGNEFADMGVRCIDQLGPKAHGVLNIWRRTISSPVSGAWPL